MIPPQASGSTLLAAPLALTGGQHSALSEQLDQVMEAISELPAGGAPPCGAGTEGKRFVVFQERWPHEVCDNTTGLFWEQEPSNALLQWDNAIAFCQDNVGADYRLPVVKDLSGLVDYSQVNPSLPADNPFDNVRLAAYWSATTFIDEDTDEEKNAWTVQFDEGEVLSFAKFVPLFTWCVHDGS